MVSLHFEGLPEDQNCLLVHGNEDLLFTAIHNIVANACKYSEDQTATVKLALSGRDFIIQVIDSGIGIRENEIEQIFQPFYRAGEPREKEGFGLGLSLASRIIKLHKGTITVKSVLNKGSTFTIVIPSAD